MTNLYTSGSKVPVHVSRAVETNTGETFCKVTNGLRHHWISLTEMVQAPTKVFADLASAGIPLVTPPAQADLKKQLQNHPVPSSAIVVKQPGWVANLV